MARSSARLGTVWPVSGASQLAASTGSSCWRFLRRPLLPAVASCRSCRAPVLLVVDEDDGWDSSSARAAAAAAAACVPFTLSRACTNACPACSAARHASSNSSAALSPNAPLALAMASDEVGAAARRCCPPLLPLGDIMLLGGLLRSQPGWLRARMRCPTGAAGCAPMRTRRARQGAFRPSWPSIHVSEFHP